jgi:hypothetical protein
VKIVPLTQGYVAVVDDADYERVMEAGPWHAAVKGSNVYAQRKGERRSRQITQTLHRFILGLEGPTPHVDHINRCGMDCRKANMRLCTRSQNGANRRKQTGTSKYRGVSWHKRAMKWVVQIKVRGRTLHLGYFADEMKAARAYDEVARACFGAFANLNFKTKG